MTKPFFVAVSVLIATWLPARLDAKAPTVKVIINGHNEFAPIEITDPAIRNFHVWAGVGARRNGVEEASGFIIDWAWGPVVEVPQGLPQFQVSFYTGPEQPDADFSATAEPKLSYVVVYAYDAGAGQGYVYIPGHREPWYEVNTRSILRNVEGKWFRASSEWQRFVTPVLSRRRWQ